MGRKKSDELSKRDDEVIKMINKMVRFYAISPLELYTEAIIHYYNTKYQKDLNDFETTKRIIADED